MPMKRFKEHSYTILDTSEGQVFIQINHQDEDAKFGNIYISDSTGARYSFSLENNVRDLEGQCDFVKVEALEGIYIANSYDYEKIQAYKEMFSSYGSSSTSMTTATASTRSTKRKEKLKFRQDMESYKQTFITFDKGGIWQPIEAPLVD